MAVVYKQVLLVGEGVSAQMRCLNLTTHDKLVSSLILSTLALVMEAKLIGLGLRNRKCGTFKVGQLCLVIWDA